MKSESYEDVEVDMEKPKEELRKIYEKLPEGLEKMILIDSLIDIKFVKKIKKYKY